jgi:site-specific DNA recombinase
MIFRGITTTGCHRPIIDVALFNTAQRILTARVEDHAKRAASGTDYLLTGLLRCPACGSAMIGTRVQGKTWVYWCYSCYRRIRYDTSQCRASRSDADAIGDAPVGPVGPVGFEPTLAGS